LLNQPVADDQRYLEALQREARLAAGLLHPNITAVHDFQVEGDSPYIIMEYVPDTLSNHLQDGQPLPYQRAVEIAIEICRGLSHAHGQGVIHRDIKPANILLDVNGDVKISDFGIARALASSTRSNTTNALGTPYYTSPEQWNNSNVDGRTDLYSLGILLYEMLTGSVPFKGDSLPAIFVQHLNDPIPGLPIVLDIPDAIEAVILPALEKEPHDRFMDADEMESDLLDALLPSVAPVATSLGTNLENITRGKYQFLERIGSGPLSTVYRARDTGLDRVVAIKVLNQPVADDPVYLEALRGIARISATLDHPNITAVYDFEVAGDFAYLVMPYVPDSLDKHLEGSRRIPYKRTVEIVTQVCFALSYAHEKGFLHDDIKSKNVFLTNQGDVKVSDFRLIQVGADSSDISFNVGSPNYMPPEHWQGRKADVRSDIYSLGVLMYEMLTGTLPFQSGSIASMYVQRQESHVPAIGPELEIPEEVEAVLRTALQADPDDRFPSADAMIDALRRASTSDEFEGRSLAAETQTGLNVKYATDIGKVSDHNNNSCLTLWGDSAPFGMDALLVVADGIGSRIVGEHAARGVASRLLLKK